MKRPTGAVVVTGATGGLGRACVDDLVARGIPVALVGRDGSALDELASACRRGGIEASTHPVDLADVDAVRRVGADSVAAHGDVRALVSTAGIYHPDDAGQSRQQLEVNLLGPLELSWALAPHLRERGGGRIVHVTSVTAFVSRGGHGLYEASKAGLVAAARSLAVDLAPDGIAVNTVAPGWIATPMTRDLLEGVDEADVRALIPVGRVAEAAEIAAVTGWLAVDAPLVLTGQTIVVDGGQSIHTDHLRTRAQQDSRP